MSTCYNNPMLVPPTRSGCPALGVLSTILVCFAQVTISPAVFADHYDELRNQMVDREIAAAGVTNEAVLRSMRTTPRHEFVLSKWRQQAYFDAALPIGDRQTISPPYIVAYMTAQLDPQPSDRVLEIGTGSGYQAAVLSPLVKEVYTVEIVPQLGRRAEHTLRRLHYDNVHVRIGDGYQGWPDAAPFDKIIVTCSPEAIPQPLIDQLAEGGRMLIPVGELYQQNLTLIVKHEGRLERKPLQATLFVPMTGQAEQERNILPNPARPQIVNAGFERVIDGSAKPVGWHYLRHVQTVTDANGNRYLSFLNSEPGQASRALQGMILDGRVLSAVRLRLRVRGLGLEPGPTPDQAASVVVTCYDQQRAVIDSFVLGPWRGSFDWRIETMTIRVPPTSREAILRLGLQGGLGQLDVDDVSIAPLPR